MSTLIHQLKSFYRRRIALPAEIDAESLVLDVGSGDKPHWRADILVDRFPDAEHAIQRSGAETSKLSRPLFDADVSDMPFADKVFDYVVCSHLLEHVLDPAAAIREIVRVGKAGYVEVPRAAGSKIIDFPSHLWWCRDDHGVLVFEAKHNHAFDPEIDALVRIPRVERALNELIDQQFDDFIIAITWTGDLAYRVDGVADPELIADVAVASIRHKHAETVATRVLGFVFALPLRGRRRRRGVTYDEIVKPELRRGDQRGLERRRYATGSG